MVPIKDPSFIGRKIDCPKCKYRFVVEDPGADEDADNDDVEEPKPAKGAKAPAAPAKKGAKSAASGVTAKKPANGKAANGKAGAPAKKKPGAKARRGDDEDGEAPAKKKKGGGSTILIAGIGLAVVGVLVLGAAAYFMFFSGGGGGGGGSGRPLGPVSGSPAGGGAGGANSGNTGDTPPGEEGTTPAAPPAAGSDITNFLPNEAEAVASLNVDRLMNSSASEAAFGTPGGFRTEGFQTAMGFPFKDVVRIVSAARHGGQPDGWQFSVVRTANPVTLDTLRNLKPVRDPKGPIEGQEFYTITGDLDSLSRFLFTTGSSKPLDVHLMDERTLVFAHAEPMQAFLTAKRQPKVLYIPPAAPSEGSTAGGPMVPPGQGPPGAGTTSPPGGSSIPPVPNGGPQGNAGPGAGGSSGPPMPGGPGGFTPPNGGGPPGGSEGSPPPPAASTAYTTVKPELKAVLDELESGKTPVIFAAAAEVHPNTNLLDQNGMEGLAKFAQFQSQLSRMPVAGVALQEMRNNRLTALVGIQLRDDREAYAAEQAVRLLGPSLVQQFGKALNLKINFPNEQNNNFPGGGAAATGPGGFTPPGTLGQPGTSGPPNGGGSFRPGGGGAGSGKFGTGSPTAPGQGEGALNGPNGPGGGPPAQEAQDDPDASKVTIRVKDKTLILGIDLNLQGHDDVFDRFLNGARLVVLQVKGREDMGGRSRIHELAGALKMYVAKTGAFPRGTVDRTALDPAAKDRAGLPYPPDERMSWMADLLPYLGQGEFAEMEKRLDRTKSWNAPENLQNALTLVPYYLSNAYPQTAWWGLYPGMTVPVANTHFVGVAGVGVDAAEYAANDPAVVKRLGVFGYDRITRKDDIADGPDKTIALIQVPADFRTPWLAGGGSTVRGVSEKDSVRPFVCATYNGKRGTFAVMCDFKVRFIPETISDPDFQALCTIAGGEPVEVDKVAPVVPADSLKTEMRAQQGPAALPTLPGLPVTVPAAPPPGTEGNKPSAPAPPPGPATVPPNPAGKGGSKQPEKAVHD
jgi:hypothetical protein